MKKEYEIIVIGGGPGGISAALYAKRAGIDVLVIDNGVSSLRKAPSIENYYGFPDGISGEELYNNGIKQAKNLGIEVITGEVTNIGFEDKYEVEILTDKKEEKILTDSLILAMGSKRNELDVPGAKELEGMGLSYCATCDGFFYKGKDVAIVGTGNFAKSEEKYLKNIVKSVTLIDENEVKEILGSDSVTGVVLKDGTTVNVDGVFVAIGTASSSALAKIIGIITEDNGKISVDENMKTSSDNVYACGDTVSADFMQVARAVYEGAIAGNNLAKDLNKAKALNK